MRMTDSQLRGGRRWALSAVLLTLGFAIAATALAQPSAAGAGEVVAIRELEMRPGADLAAFERFVTGSYNPAWQNVAPGMRGYVAKADRGAHKGQYVFVLIFDSVKARDAIFPKEGGGAADRFAPQIDKALALNKALEKFIEPASFSIYTDYVALR